MNIIVTGGEGFIGKKLIEKLLKENHNVISIDKSSPTNNKIINLKEDISNVDFVEKIKSTIPISNIDYIFHVAAQPGGYFSLKYPYVDSQWNCTGTTNIVKLGQELKIKKLVYISSMAVYGNEKNATENISQLNPISFYGVSKTTGEMYTKLIHTHSKIPYTIFRLFATYGAGQDLNNKHQGILSIYLDQALNSTTLKITGSKKRVRELIHVDDVVNALLYSFDSRTDNQIYNVSNEEELTPEIIIRKIGESIGKELNIEELEGYEGDQTYITSNTSKLRSLGWVPQLNITEGIQEFIKNIK